MQNSTNNYTDILNECSKIGKERMKGYGNPIESMQDACDILEKIFKIKLTIEEMSYVLVSLKLSRQMQSHNDDNIIDTINYLAISLDAKRKICKN